MVELSDLLVELRDVRKVMEGLDLRYERALGLFYYRWYEHDVHLLWQFDPHMAADCFEWVENWGVQVGR